MRSEPETRAAPRVLVVAPFTHQNGHFVTFPRDVCCGLAALGVRVTLVHARPFRKELDWFGQDVERLCLKAQVDAAPWWWREVWHRLAPWPSTQCLAWMLWRLRPGDHDLVLWTDFQAQSNVWPLALARALRLYRQRTVLFEHHPPYDGLRRKRVGLDLEQHRLRRLTMVLLSRAHLALWRDRLGPAQDLHYVPYGVWPQPAGETERLAARAALGIAPDARVLLVFGVQAVQRKHLDTLHAALLDYPDDAALTVLFTGRTLGPSPHPFAQWSRPGIDVRLEDRFVSDEEAARHFAAADAVWTCYRDFPGASGVLLQCIGFGRIAIGAAEGEIGELCRQHALGPVVAEATPPAVRVALQQALHLPAEARRAWESRIAAQAAAFAWPVSMRQLMQQLALTLPLPDPAAVATPATAPATAE